MKDFDRLHEQKLKDDLMRLLMYRPDHVALNAAGWVIRVRKVNDHYEVRFPWVPEPLRPEALHAYAMNENGNIPISWKLVRMIDDAIRETAKC